MLQQQKSKQQHTVLFIVIQASPIHDNSINQMPIYKLKLPG